MVIRRSQANGTVRTEIISFDLEYLGIIYWSPLYNKSFWPATRIFIVATLAFVTDTPNKSLNLFMSTTHRNLMLLPRWLKLESVATDSWLDNVIFGKQPGFNFAQKY